MVLKPNPPPTRGKFDAVPLDYKRNAIATQLAALNRTVLISPMP